MYLRTHPISTMQQPPMFNPPYQPGPQNVMMTSPARNLQISQSWANPSAALSMDTVTINPSVAMNNLPRHTTIRQQQPNHGSSYSHRMGHNSCENSALPQLSIRDLQCLDTAPQSSVMSQSESQQLFHMQHQRDEHASESQAQNHLGNQNQGLQTAWPTFNTLNAVQNPFNGSVPGGGGGAQGLGSFPFLDGMQGDDLLKGLVGASSQTGFQLKQEPQMTVGQDTHASLMQSQRESQGNTYTNLLPRPMSNGTNMDQVIHDGSGISQAFKNLQNPFPNNSMAPENHFSTLADWIEATRQSD